MNLAEMSAGLKCAQACGTCLPCRLSASLLELSRSRDAILDEAIKAVLSAEPQADVTLDAEERELAQAIRRASCFRIACLKDAMPAHVKRALAESDIPS